MTKPEDIISMIREGKSPTDQQIFDAVTHHLLKQGRQSVRPDAASATGTRCAYRGDDGCSCAVGCLIPDDVYQPWLDGEAGGSITEVLRNANKKECPLDARWLNFFQSYRYFLELLQEAHDLCLPDKFANQIRDELIEVAECFSLAQDALHE